MQTTLCGYLIWIRSESFGQVEAILLLYGASPSPQTVNTPFQVAMTELFVFGGFQNETSRTWLLNRTWSELTNGYTLVPLQK